MLYRILGCNHEKRLRQWEALRVNRDLAFVHGFEQRGLRFWRGAVDFVGQKHVRENRPSLKLEFLLGCRINRNAYDIGRQHVTGELHALEAAAECARQGVSQSGLSHAGDTFDQQMSAGEDRNQRQSNDIVFAANDFFELIFEARGLMRGGNDGFERHGGDSTMRAYVFDGYLSDLAPGLTKSNSRHGFTRIFTD